MLPFEWIERIFGYVGLCLLVYVVAAIDLGPDWGDVGDGLVPHVSAHSPTIYAYFAVGLIAAALMPYEVYFYSSGGIEERWTPKDLNVNRLNAIAGTRLLSRLAMVAGLLASQ